MHNAHCTCIRKSHLFVLNLLFEGSQQEREKISNAYTEYHGDLRKIMRSIPFLRWSEKSRIVNIIDGNAYHFDFPIFFNHLTLLI